MPAPKKHPKDSEGKPAGPSETDQVKILLDMRDKPVSQPGKKPIQHPAYKQLRDTIVASAKARAVYSVKSPGYVDMLRDLVHGNQVPALNRWIPYWKDRETPGTEGENFYSHLSWLVQDVIKNMKAGVKRDKKKEGGEDISLPQTSSIADSRIRSSPPAPPPTTFPISLIAFRRPEADESPPTVDEWRLTVPDVLTTVLSVVNPTFSTLKAATRRFTEPLNLEAYRYYGLKKPEIVDDAADSIPALRRTDVVALQMDAQVSGFVSQMEKFGKEIVIGVAVGPLTPQEVVPPTPRRARKNNSTVAPEKTSAPHPSPPLPAAPAQPAPPQSSEPCTRCLASSKHRTDPLYSSDLLSLDLDQLSFPSDAKGFIRLNRTAYKWKLAFDYYMQRMKDDAESKGLYDSVCFADELCFYHYTMKEEDHAMEKSCYAASGYSNLMAVDSRVSFPMPEEGSRMWHEITKKLETVRRRRDGVAYVYVPQAALARLEAKLSEMEEDFQEEERAQLEREQEEERAGLEKEQEEERARLEREQEEERAREDHMMSFADVENAQGPLSPPREEVERTEVVVVPSPFLTALDQAGTKPPPSAAPLAPAEPSAPAAPPTPAAPERDSSPSSDMTDIDAVEARVPEKLRRSDGVDDALHRLADEADRDLRSGRSSARKRYPQGSWSAVNQPAKRRR